MKIHIDTSPQKKNKSQQQHKKPQQKKPAQSQAGTQPAAGQQQPAAQPKKTNLPKSPPAEPSPPDDVAQARKNQTRVLKERQRREVQGKVRGPQRDIDAGAGFWPPLSPLL